MLGHVFVFSRPVPCPGIGAVDAFYSGYEHVAASKLRSALHDKKSGFPIDDYLPIK